MCARFPQPGSRAGARRLAGQGEARRQEAERCPGYRPWQAHSTRPKAPGATREQGKGRGARGCEGGGRRDEGAGGAGMRRRKNERANKRRSPPGTRPRRHQNCPQKAASECQPPALRAGRPRCSRCVARAALQKRAWCGGAGCGVGVGPGARGQQKGGSPVVLRSLAATVRRGSGQGASITRAGRWRWQFAREARRSGECHSLEAWRAPGDMGPACSGGEERLSKKAAPSAHRRGRHRITGSRTQQQ